MPILSCKEPDCHRKVQSRGMCTTHYSYWYRAQYGRKDPTYTKPCARCSKQFTTTTKRVIYCSLVCAQRARTSSGDIVLHHRPRVWLGATLPPRKGNALVAGQCAYCPTYYIGLHGSRYCSNKCATNASWMRRYERRGEFKVTDKVRLAVYERDNYTCQLCNEAVDVDIDHKDRMSATLDHIVPQSWMLIPDHTIGNLRLAHRICNSLRGDRADAA